MNSSSTITYNLELLEEYSNNMKYIANTLLDIQSTIDSFSKDIDSFWTGNAKEVFMDNKKQSTKDIEELSNQINTNSEKLSQSIDIYKEKSGIVSNTVDVLSTANIFSRSDYYMLNIDVAVLDLVKNNLSKLSEDLNVQANRMNSIIQDIQEAWQSDYTYMYIQSVEKVKSDIDKLITNVDKTGNSVGYISTQVKQAEEQLKNKFI